MRSMVFAVGSVALGVLLAAGAHAQVRISQIWSGGGSGVGTGPAADVVELYNAGPTAQSLSGWAIQYSGRVSTTWTTRELSGTIPARGYFLIKLTSDSISGGQPLAPPFYPTPDLSFADSADTGGISSAGKIVITPTVVPLSGACPGAPGTAIDLVGYSFSSTLPPNCLQGTPAPGSDVSTTPARAIRRRCAGLVNTFNNGSDFEQYGAIVLRNSSSPPFNGIFPTAVVNGSSAVAPGATVSFLVSSADCNGNAAGTSGTANLTELGGGASVPLSVSGFGVFALTTTVPTNLSVGLKTITFTINGAAGAFGSTTSRLTVTVANDECAGAVTLTGAGPFSWSNAGATTSTGQQSFAGCDLGTTLVDGIGGDVWYRWTAPSSGAFTLTTFGTLPASVDTSIALYANACPPGAPIVCNDDAPIPNGPLSSLSFEATAGTTYLIQVGSTPGSFTTSGRLNITAGDPGACCLPNFAGCSAVVSQTACTALGGLFRGSGSTCANTNCPQPTGRCCFSDGTCDVLTQGVCGVTGSGGVWTLGLTCDPNTCGSASIVCCRGTTCTLVSAAGDCSVPAGSTLTAVTTSDAACNVSGDARTPCCYADIDKNGATSVDDIFLFLGGWFTQSPFTKFAGDGVAAPALDDIFLFLQAWFAGCQ